MVPAYPRLPMPDRDPARRRRPDRRPRHSLWVARQVEHAHLTVLRGVGHMLHQVATPEVVARIEQLSASSGGFSARDQFDRSAAAKVRCPPHCCPGTRGPSSIRRPLGAIHGSSRAGAGDSRITSYSSASAASGSASNCPSAITVGPGPRSPGPPGPRAACRHGRCRRSPPPGRRRSSSAPRAPRRRAPRRGSAAPRPCPAATRRAARRNAPRRATPRAPPAPRPRAAGRARRRLHPGPKTPAAPSTIARRTSATGCPAPKTRAFGRRLEDLGVEGEVGPAGVAPGERRAIASRPAPSARSALTSSSAACGNISKTSAAGCSASDDRRLVGVVPGIVVDLAE